MRRFVSRLLITACLLSASPAMADPDDIVSLPAASSPRAVIGPVLAAAPAPMFLDDGESYLITFKTGAPGVDLPDKLRRRFPDLMTVILQYDYAVVGVTDETFTLMLHFDDALTPVTIPFAGVTHFSDVRNDLHLYWDGSPTLPDPLQKP